MSAVANLRSLHNAATPGPWTAMRQGNQYVDGALASASVVEPLSRPWNPHSVRMVNIERELGEARMRDEDADFVVAVHNAMEALLDLAECAEGVAINRGADHKDVAEFARCLAALRAQ